MAFVLTRSLIFGQRLAATAEYTNPWANPLIEAGWVTQLGTALALLFLSVRLMAIPTGLCPVWSIGGFEMASSFARFDVLLGAAVLVALLIVSVVGLRRGWRVGVLAAWLLLFLLVPTHLIPAANWLFAERWLLLPSAVLLVLISGVGAHWRLAASAKAAAIAADTGGQAASSTQHHGTRHGGTQHLAIITLLIAAIPLGARLCQYQQSWRTTEQVMAATLARQPNSYHGLTGLAAIAVQQDRIKDVTAELDRLKNRFPDAPKTWAFWGPAHGRPEQATGGTRRYRTARRVTVRPRSPTPHRRVAGGPPTCPSGLGSAPQNKRRRSSLE